MNVRDYAVLYDAWQGVKLWFMPYRTLQVENAIRSLETVQPHFEYRNTKTGETTTVKPEALTKAEQVAAKKSQVAGRTVEVKTHWQTRNLWGGTENTFVIVLPLIVDAEFGTDLNAQTRNFQALWGMRNAPVAERWEAFLLLIGTDTDNALWHGYEQTRDRSFEPTEAEADDGEGEAEATENPLPESAPAS